MKGFKGFPKKRTFLLAILLPIFIVSLFGLDFASSWYVKNFRLEKLPAVGEKLSSYPVLSGSTLPILSAQSAIVMDDDSKTILFSKNPALRFSTASTAKIMTALVALDFYKMKDILTVQSDNAEPFVLGFKTGERFKFLDLLYSLLLPSANDAALALAENYPGGESAFVEKMNETARRLYLTNTHFGDPAGLLDGQDYTSVLDLARLASFALKNKDFAKIVSTTHKVFSSLDGKEYSVYNRNKLLGVDGVDGIKTGYTEEAGEVLVTSKMKDGHRLILAVMGSTDRFLDTLSLLNLTSDKITYLPIHP